MDETVSDSPNALTSGRLPLPGVTIAGHENLEPSELLYTPEELRAAQIAWLQWRGFDPTNPKEVPHLTMNLSSYERFRTAEPVEFADTKSEYGIPDEDQTNCQFVLIDVSSDDPGQPPSPVLMDVTEEDFGTRIGLRKIAKDLQGPDADPDNPVLPELPGGAYHTVDITMELATSTQDLKDFARELMSGRTENPFYSSYGNIGVRAGGIAPGQKDAYVWTGSRFTKSVELTIAFPLSYNSVCIVSGQVIEAGNEKRGMAQIKNPREELTIEGEDLTRLQNVYRKLYHEPDFALTVAQREERERLFNGYLEELITDQARSNEAEVEEAEEEDRHGHELEYRYHDV